MAVTSENHPRTVISDQYVDRGKLRNLLDTLHGSDNGKPNYDVKVSEIRDNIFHHPDPVLVEGKSMDHQSACPAFESKKLLPNTQFCEC